MRFRREAQSHHDPGGPMLMAPTITYLTDIWFGPGVVRDSRQLAHHAGAKPDVGEIGDRRRHQHRASWVMMGLRLTAETHRFQSIPALRPSLPDDSFSTRRS